MKVNNTNLSGTSATKKSENSAELANKKSVNKNTSKRSVPQSGTIILSDETFKKAHIVKNSAGGSTAGEVMRNSASVGELGGQVMTDDDSFSGHLGTSTVAGLLHINERLKQLKSNKEKYTESNDDETKAFYKEKIKADLGFLAKEGSMTLSKLGKSGLNFEVMGELSPINAKELLDNIGLLKEDGMVRGLAKHVEGFETIKDKLLDPVLEILNENVAELIQDVGGPVTTMATSLFVGVKDLFDLKKANKKKNQDAKMPSADSYEVGDKKFGRCIEAAINLRKNRNKGRTTHLKNRLAVSGAKVGILTGGLATTIATGGIAGPIVLGCTGIPSIGYAIQKGIRQHLTNNKTQELSNKMAETEKNLQERKFQLEQLNERIVDINDRLSDELNTIPHVDVKLEKLAQLEVMQPGEFNPSEYTTLVKELKYVLTLQEKAINFEDESKNLESITYNLGDQHEELFENLLATDSRFVAGQLLEGLVQESNNAEDSEKNMRKFILDYWTRGKAPEDPGTLDKIKRKAGEVAKSSISKAKHLVGKTTEKKEATPEVQLDLAIKNWKSENDTKKQAAIDVLIHHIEIKQKFGQKLPDKKKEEKNFLKSSAPAVDIT